MSNERSAEWLRGAVESHINTCNLITSITSAAKSHPARQGLMAASNELHNQLDRYRTLLAAAEAREATLPTAAEVIEAFEKALATIADPIECGCKPCTGDCQSIAAKAIYFEGQQEVAADALAVIARWKEAK